MSIEALIRDIDEILNQETMDELLGPAPAVEFPALQPETSEQTDLQLVRMLAGHVLELVERERREHGKEVCALKQRLKVTLRRLNRAEVFASELEKALADKEAVRLAREEANAAAFTEAAEEPLPF